MSTAAVIFILLLMLLKWLAFGAAAGLTVLSLVVALRKWTLRAVSFALIASAALIIALCYIPGLEYYKMYGIQTELKQGAKIIKWSLGLSVVAALFQPGYRKWISGAAVVAAYIAFVLQVI